MDFSWPIFIAVLLLGILQVAMGVIIGRALPFGERKADRTVERRAGHLVQLASRLFRLLSSVAEDVDRHQARIKHASHALSTAHSGEGGRLAEFVLKTLAEIVRVNERLQNRLSAAEEKLQKQARQIEALYMSKRTGRNCGHFHDGETCQPIPPGGQVPDDNGENPPGAGDGAPAEIQDACDDLRTRLIEITEEP